MTRRPLPATTDVRPRPAPWKWNGRTRGTTGALLGLAVVGLAACGASKGASEAPVPGEGRHAVLASGDAYLGSIAKRRVRDDDGLSLRRARVGTSSTFTGTLFGIQNERTLDMPLDRLLREGDRPLPNNGLCPPDMATIDDRFCVDRYEASLVEILPNGDERAWSPYVSVEGHVVRAVSLAGVAPQGYISGRQAADACVRSGKRLCRASEWKTACMGPAHVKYGYGADDEPRRCNDYGRSPVTATWSGSPDERGAWGWAHMNRTDLNQLEGTLKPTGSHPGCTNGYGVFDMVGNLHEWIDDPRGTFQGGYYQDTHLNGDGCGYKTSAHDFTYHDYSTGFRCCADVAP
ncbi:MAG: SUMF1/EgtB/PvdO family nonheme iron enzyme [Polyangiaceae bacterium]